MVKLPQWATAKTKTKTQGTFENVIKSPRFFYIAMNRMSCRNMAQYTTRPK
jgi:hypothetical protein